MTNRVGDALILGSLLLGVHQRRFRLPRWQQIARSVNIVFGTLLVLGAFTKRAQLPFCAWLPAAMAAPTPVSSLVHSSTLVTAGVYVLIRLDSALPGEVKKWVVVVGRLTMLLAGVRALGEVDMKKIVALSTLRQLGIMVMAIGAGRPLIAFYHLIAHAFFKALLFVGVGNLIHSAGSYQDFYFTGRLRANLPLTRGVLIVAKARLCGLPFFSGFFSKEAVLEGLDLGGSGGRLV